MTLGIRQRIDDAAEQDRFHENREGKRHVGDGQDPTQAGLAPEKLENAKIETQKLHGGKAAAISREISR
jgi:hypothetical protein